MVPVWFMNRRMLMRGQSTSFYERDIRFSQVKLFGMFPFEVFKIKFDFAHILFNISAWIQIFVGSDTFLFVVNTDQNNGNLRAKCNVIKPFFHSGLADRVPSGVMAR